VSRRPGWTVAGAGQSLPGDRIRLPGREPPTLGMIGDGSPALRWRRRSRTMCVAWAVLTRAHDR